MSLKSKVIKGLRLTKKSFYRNLILRNRSKDKPIILIMACHRSGTSILLSAFQKDIASKTFGEFGILHIQAGTKILRLKSIEKIKQILNSYASNYFVLKPLAEIPNATTLLNNFSNSFIIWIYRDYRDVASSNLKQFGNRNGIDDLRPIIKNDKTNWRSFGTSKNTFEKIKANFSEDMNEIDAAAWFWYSRNILFIEQGLHTNKNVIIIKYEDLVKNPALFFKHICKTVGIKYNPLLISDFHDRSVGKGRSIDLSEEVNQECNKIYKILETAYHKQAFIKNKEIS